MRQKMSFGELPQEKGYLNEGEALQIPLANGNACGNEQKGSSKGIRASQRLEVKTCPVCGARCFSDMDTCYNCLHSFVHDEMKSEETFGDNAKAPLVSLEKGVEVIVNISFAKSPCSKNGETVPTVMIETR